jgi:hypothetical protein
MTQEACTTNLLPGGRMVRRCLAGFVLAACVVALPRVSRAEMSQPGNGQAASGADTTVGMEGTHFVRADGALIDGALEARPFEENSPILIRIADVARDGDSYIHEIRYIGFYPGAYDLRDWLMHSDGRAVTEIPPANVIVASVLPEQHSGELAQWEQPAWLWVWPYRAMLVLAAVVWVLPLAWVVGRRLVRRKPRAIDRDANRPTLADQLAPLVASVLHDRGNSQQHAQLERLLLAYWRQRLDLNGLSTVETIRKMRDDEQAGALLRSLEAWLHMPPGEVEVDVPALLEPYRNAAAIETARAMQHLEEVTT